MECWVPLFKIFLNSPCPESEASIWLQKNFNLPSNTIPISTASFVSLLTKYTDIASIPPQNKRVMWIQTLPLLVQARILSFLAYDRHRFSRNNLCKLSRAMLSQDKCLDFWVKKAAQRLLDLVSESNYQWLSHFNLDSEEEITEEEEEEFYSMPDWLKETTEGEEPIFPWLPMSPYELRQSMPLTVNERNEEDLSIHMEESKQEELDEVAGEVDVNDHPVDTEVERKAESLKSRLLNAESIPEVLNLAKEIPELCFENKRNALAVLNLIEPWCVDDETAAVLISQLSDHGSEDDELDWPAHILCSIILPKFLVLNKSSSHVLMAATIEYCKAHQRAAEYALLFPLLLKHEGINNYICDAITRILRECLHPGQVSAFCQKLVCRDRDAWRLFTCLPCHRTLIAEELVWTESLFCFWQNIMNHNSVRLTDNSVTELIRRACEFSERYSKSLKFGNFLLCLVGRCGPYLKPYKILLIEAVEKTESLVTKSVLSKLSGL